MHEIVTGAAQPGHGVEAPLGVPTALAHLVVRRARDEVVVCERDPVAATQLAGRWTQRFQLSLGRR